MSIVRTITINWKYVVCGFLIIIIANSCYSQNEPVTFKQISVDEGLMQNWVRCIYQDESGYMWFGTSGGLNRYDGYDFKEYKLGNVHVNDIKKKSDHELWIANDLGVYIYNQSNDSIYPFAPLQEQTVLFIFRDKNRQIWFGASSGLYRYNCENEKMVHYTHNEKDSTSISYNYVKSILEDSDGDIWIGTSVGLNKYVKSSDTFIRYKSSKEQGSLSGSDILTIVEDANKRIWIGTAQNGVNLLIKKGKDDIRFKKIVDGYIISLMIDNQNNLWIGRGSNGGLLKLNLNNFSLDQEPFFEHYVNNKLDPKSLSDNSIFCFYQDDSDDIWIGTFSGGVSYFSYRTKKFYTVKEGINKNPVIRTNIVNAILEEDRYLWIATEVGLDRYDKINGKSKHYEYEKDNERSLSSNPVCSLYKDSKGNLWAGTWGGGLNLYNYTTDAFKRFIPDDKPGSLSNGNVFSITEDLEGDLWVATIGGGANRYDYNTGKFTHYFHDEKNPKSLSNDIVHDILVTKEGEVFLSAHGSLDEYIYATNDFVHYPLNTGGPGEINDNYVVSIYEDSKGNIWLATNSGLSLFNKSSGHLHNYTIEHGLPDNGIKAIQEDDRGNLWISTNKGLAKFVDGVNHPETPYFINFTISDGLSGNEFKKRADFKNKSGVLYFGSSGGYTYFHPDSILLNNIPPKVVFTEMQLLESLSNKNVRYKSMFGNINTIDTIVLSYNNSDFVIKFASLNYLNPRKNKYRYKLEGYDENWIDANSTREAIYKNLRNGSYKFLVYGSNNDGVWCESPRELQILILPPWWKTLTFKVFLVLFIILIVLAFYRISFSILRMQKRKLEAKVKERTQELSHVNALMEEKQEEITIQNAELDKHRNHLEQLVEERTFELEIEKAKAEESDRLKTAFLNNISHEIRTPLNAIIGFSGFLENPELEFNYRVRCVCTIINSSHQLLSIIDDIINVSTLEAGKATLDKSSFNLNEVLINVHEFHKTNAQIKKISFSYEMGLGDDNAIIISDKIKLSEALNKLVKNAIKFTKEGHVKFGYKVKEDTLEFFVEDTGIGISKEQQEIIFEQFRQVEVDLTREYGGTGLGLSISKSYIELLGGKIWLESELDVGSTFYFTIPHVKSSKKLVVKEVHKDDKALITKDKKTILVAEDEDLNFQLIEIILSNSNLDLIWAFNGQEAVEKCKINSIDLVLMDIKMPMMDGLEATKQIKSFMPDVPIIAQTAYAQDSDRKKIMESGFDDYIAKPIKKEKLHAIINKFL